MPEIEFVERITDYEPRSTNIILDTVGAQRRISEFRDIQDIGLWIGPE